jgi:hypothetical protein
MDADRRSLLRMVALAGGGAVAGCTGVSGNAPNTDQSAAGTPELPDSASAYPVNEGALDVLAHDRQGTYETIELGEQSDVSDAVEYVTPENASESDTDEFWTLPHEILVYDFAGVSQVDVVIFDMLAETIIYNTSHEIPTQRSLTIRLLTPSKYVVRVSLPETRHTLRIPCDYFDCNTSATRIGILEGFLGGTQIKSSVISSDAGCAASYTC